jgi:hypothetical protein
MELSITFREFSPEGLPGSVQLFPALLDDPTELCLDLCEDGQVVMDKVAFRKLAGLEEGVSIGRGRLSWNLINRSFYIVSE